MHLSYFDEIYKNSKETDWFLLACTISILQRLDIAPKQVYAGWGGMKYVHTVGSYWHNTGDSW
jgi:hypothetical protein